MIGIGTIQPARGSLDVITVANPAAGAEFLYTIPALRTVILLQAYWVLTCDANVANRVPSIVLTDGTDTIWHNHTATPVTAGQVALIGHSAGIMGWESPNAGGSINLGPLPLPCFLNPGFTIGSDNDSIQVGDQISAIRLTMLTEIIPT